MGMRLDGPAARHTSAASTSPPTAIAPGSIQVPGNGEPIVLLADRQTTGGYPKIATVISADLPALGRLPIGAKIAFEPVTIEAAEARAAQAARRDRWHRAARSCRSTRSGADVAARLLDCNLISGVVDARMSDMRHEWRISPAMRMTYADSTGTD